MSIEKYENEPYYQLGTPRYEGDKVRTYLMEFWAKFLDDRFATAPLLHIITFQPFNIGATEIFGKTFFDIKLYHGDVLNFKNGLAVIDQDVELLGGTETEISVLKTYFQSGEKEVETVANSYALIPFRSISDGGFGGIQRTDSAQNLLRDEGLYATKAMTRKAYEIRASGDVVRDDPFLNILGSEESINRGRKLYLETRFRPYVKFNYFDGTFQDKGAGSGAIRSITQIFNHEVRGTSTDEFMLVDFNVYMDGQVYPYKILDPIIEPRFCPNNLSLLYSVSYRRRSIFAPSRNFCPIELY